MEPARPPTRDILPRQPVTRPHADLRATTDLVKGDQKGGRPLEAFAAPCGDLRVKIDYKVTLGLHTSEP